MGISVKKEHIDKYMKIMKLRATGQYLFVQIIPLSQRFIYDVFGLTPLATKSKILAFTKDLILLIDLDPLGHFVAQHAIIQFEDIESIDFKKRWMQSKLTIQTNKGPLLFKVPNSLADIAWQEPNLKKLIDNGWRV